ncbi:MAG: hypothetical protein R6X25_01935 [Candidatus Krumholzibacteriia bacterium]
MTAGARARADAPEAAVFLHPSGPGFGHVRRMLAVAARLRDQGVAPVFVMGEDQEKTALVTAAGHRVATVASPEGMVRAAAAGATTASGAVRQPVVVLDTRPPAPELVPRLQARGARVLVLDVPDLPGADLTVIPAIGHPDRPAAGVRAGADFLVVDEAVCHARPELPPLAERHGILITFGGLDPAGITFKALAAVAPLASMVPLHLVIGPQFAHAGEVRRRAADVRRTGNVLVHESPAGLAPIMRRCGMAVTAFGITVHELLCLGVPPLLVWNYPADAEAATAVEARGCALALGHHQEVTTSALTESARRLWLDSARREAMSAHGQDLVDGRGAERIAHLVLDLARNGGAGPQPSES